MWDPKYTFPHIVCAANRTSTGFIIAGARHHDIIMRNQIEALGNVERGSEQGFIDQFGTFYTRKEAWDMVQYNGQPFNLKRNGSTGVLYSEGLY